VVRDRRQPAAASLGTKTKLNRETQEKIASIYENKEKKKNVQKKRKNK